MDDTETQGVFALGFFYLSIYRTLVPLGKKKYSNVCMQSVVKYLFKELRHMLEA